MKEVTLSKYLQRRYSSIRECFEQTLVRIHVYERAKKDLNDPIPFTQAIRDNSHKLFTSLNKCVQINLHTVA